MNRPKAEELVELIARMRLSTEGEDATLAEEITGEDDELHILDELIVSARQIAKASPSHRRLLKIMARDLRDIEDKSARDPNYPRSFWVRGNFNLDLIEWAEAAAKDEQA